MADLLPHIVTIGATQYHKYYKILPKKVLQSQDLGYLKTMIRSNICTSYLNSTIEYKLTKK